MKCLTLLILLVIKIFKNLTAEKKIKFGSALNHWKNNFLLLTFFRFCFYFLDIHPRTWKVFFIIQIYFIKWMNSWSTWNYDVQHFILTSLDFHKSNFRFLETQMFSLIVNFLFVFSQHQLWFFFFIRTPFSFGSIIILFYHISYCYLISFKTFDNKISFSNHHFNKW